MAKQSAGIVLYRFNKNVPEIFLVHPGGPLWIKKDLGAWSIPKGEFSDGENPQEVARREFYEETGTVFEGEMSPLKPVKLKSGKIVYAWASEGDIDPSTIISNSFTLEWPPRSGRQQEFPEVDKGEWFSIKEAREKINPAQVPLIDELVDMLDRK